MKQEERLDFLIDYLIQEDSKNRYFSQSLENKKDILRSMLNIRPALPISEEFLQIQDEFLQEELKHKKITKIADIEEVAKDIYLWQGDICTLEVDAIVNAANSQMLGCFIPCHACIDNIIHTQAGVQLRLFCNDCMQAQGKAEETGKAKISPAYNLPSKHILHTVGPIILHNLEQKDCDLLASCYTSCLELADEHKLTSIAFCCISTGEFRFPNKEASQIALRTVQDYKKRTDSPIKVIFNVFKEIDHDLYRRLF